MTSTGDPADEASRIIADRYRVDGALARGGMAEVFAVTDLQERRKLALKYLRPEASADPRIATLFRLEFHTLRRISHPNIIEVFDFGVDDGHAFYTMELLDGSDLSKLAPVEPMRACALLRDVATSLSLLHTQRFLHRDISPRNVRLTHAGRCKLIDFGAMARFGSANDLVGTPPLVAPECLQGGSLDQRTDLFALGGLAYHLLTGKHAYPARTFRDLPECWKRKVAPPSSYAPSVPKALDELVMSLLKLEPAARPTNAALVIDRLSSIAGLTPEPERGTRESYLESSMLAGRERELAKLRAGLQAALGGHGSAVMIESNPGVGKSRLLQEMASEAQLAGMIVAQVDARATQGTYGVVRALYTALSRSAPADVEHAFAAHAPMLGHVLPELQAPLATLPVDIGERRTAIQVALLAAFAALDEQRPLALFIDDIEHADDASLLFLKSLARNAKEASLFLVSSQTLASTLAGKATLASFNRSLSHMRLHRLRRTGTAELVRSIFGDLPNVERWAIYLHQATAGDPSQLLQLMRHLVDSGHIAYVGGTWSLPTTMPESSMPDAMIHALRTRSMRLGPGARTLAELIALYEGSITVEVLVAASELSDDDVLSALDELIFAGICVVSGGEYRLSQPAFRHALRTELAAVR
ncbi:MAG TPA: protein kinase, partial [Polyangiales bacterium]|nr:protein kinase [Polyangiales bacterium]